MDVITNPYWDLSYSMLVKMPSDDCTLNPLCNKSEFELINYQSFSPVVIKNAPLY